MNTDNKDINKEMEDGEVHQGIQDIVNETKDIILNEPDEKQHLKPNEPEHATDEEVKKAVEIINPDASSMESRG